MKLSEVYKIADALAPKSISDEYCDVVLDMGEVTDAKRAQVEDIVKRKTGVAADKIIITPINAGGK